MGSNPVADIKGLKIFDHCYIYSAYADDATIFLRVTFSMKHMADIFKNKLAGIGVLTRVEVEVCGMRFIDLSKLTLKIIYTHFSYNEKLKERKNFYKTASDI